MDKNPQFDDLFVLGKEAFAKGYYRQSLEYFSQAQELISGNTRQGGDLQIWLITVYQALDQSEKAIALAQKLTTHPNFTIKKQAQDLLFILQAPRLQRPKEWMTEIPDLTQVSEQENKISTAKIGKKDDSKKGISNVENLNTIENVQKENNFFLFALIILLLTILLIFGNN